MFIPGPQYNYTLYAIYKVNDQKLYSLLIQEVLYQRNGLNGDVFLNLSFTNSRMFIHANSIHVKNNMYRFSHDKYFNVLQNTTYQYHRKKRNGQISNLTLILAVKHLQTGERLFLVA